LLSLHTAPGPPPIILGPPYFDDDIGYDTNGTFEDNTIGQRNKRVCPDPIIPLVPPTFHFCLDTSHYALRFTGVMYEYDFKFQTGPGPITTAGHWILSNNIRTMQNSLF